MSEAISRRWRLALAVLLALVGAAAVALLATDEDADGVRATAGRWTTLQPSPLSRSENAAGRVGRFIYVVGGFVPPDAANSNQVARYDTRSGTWSVVAPMPLAVNHPAVTASRGRLFVYGGYTDPGALSGETDALQSYNPATDSWTMLAASGVRRGAATLAPVGRKLYAIGGAAAASPMTVVQVYDISNGTWAGGPSMRVPRDHLGSGVIGHRILVLGGRNLEGNTDAVEVFNTRTRKWRSLPHLRVPRSGFQAVVVRGHVVAVGGEQLNEGNQTIGAVEIYDPDEKRWRSLPGMITPRHGLGVASKGRTIFAAEGGPQQGLSYTNALEALRVPKKRLQR